MAPRSIDFNVLAQAAETRKVAAGEVVFSAGDPGGELYVVKSGSIEIRREDRVLEVVESAGIFGEMALIDGAPRSATAVAASDSEIVPVGERQFTFLVGQTPYFALNVMAVMARRLRAANLAGPAATA